MKRIHGLELLLLATLTACASTQALIHAPPAVGARRVYPDSLPRVANGAREAVVRAGLQLDTIVRPDSQTIMIIAKKGMQFFSNGELVRVLAQPLPDGQTAVRVHTIPRLSTNFLYTTWDDDVLAELGRALARSAVRDSSGSFPWAPSVEALRSLAPDAYVRVAPRSGSRIKGPVSMVTSLEIALGSHRAVPAAAIESLWVRKSHARIGALFGALVGGTVGLVIAHHHGQHCFQGFGDANSCAVEEDLIAFGALTGGILAGAGVGSLIPKWKLRFP
jgi:hypothetical protein